MMTTHRPQTQTWCKAHNHASILIMLLDSAEDLDFSSAATVADMLVHGDEKDFEHGGYRFIHSSVIDSVQCSDLESDPYGLGYFNAWFLSDITGIPTDAIENIQKSGGGEGIGHMIANDSDMLSDLQYQYSSQDGYEAHFGQYDGLSTELHEWYMFRTE